MSPTSDFQLIAEQALAKPDHTIVGTVGNTGRPVYFLAPKDADNATVRDLAFKAKWGRDMQEGERGLLEAALKERPAMLDATLEDLTRD